MFVIGALFERGGTTQTNYDLMQALQDEVETFLLRSDGSKVELFNVRGDCEYLLDHAVLDEPLAPFPHANGQYDDVVASWLREYAIEAIHVRHIAFHSLDLLEIARAVHVPVLFSFHDYYAICPTVKLLDENNRFCSGHCTKTDGDCTPEFWREGAIGRLKHHGVFPWKQQFSRRLEHCAAFATTAQSARTLIHDHFPAARSKPFFVIPHGRDFRVFANPPTWPSDNENLRILAIGNLNASKGSDYLAALAKDAKALGIEIHVLGQWLPSERPEDIVLHGAYDRDALVEKVQSIAPHIGCVLSIWAETWCHVLTELWAAGLPVLGFDIGAVGERLQESGAGWLVPIGTAHSLAETVRKIRGDPSGYRLRCDRVLKWQRTTGKSQNCARMGSQYNDVYARLCREFGFEADEAA